jgi:hypothetical protein
VPAPEAKTRPMVEKSEAPVAPRRPAAKKPKVKFKPKVAAPKGSRSARKRFVPTR